MPTATIRWVNERNFVGVDSTGHSVVLSGQKDGIGVSPSQMLLVALAACSSVDVVEILEKKRKTETERKYYRIILPYSLFPALTDQFVPWES